jgi:hypothetical protein
MSGAAKDGGPAFPDYTASGMSLRDWFAGQQMVRIGIGWPNEDNMREIAANCYAMADAMLAARAGLAKANTEQEG